MIKAISPAEAMKARSTDFPVEVIYAVNELIKQRWRGRGNFILKQNEVLQAVLHEFARAGKTVTEADVFQNGWLDFEPIFEKEGWKVIYDKPGWDESYAPYFKFSSKDQHNG